MNKNKLKIYLNIILLVLVCLPAVNIGIAKMLGMNFIEIFSNLFGSEGNEVNVFIYLVSFASAIVLLMTRDSYLPFLGTAAIPAPQEDTEPMAAGPDTITKEVKNLPPNVKVLFWAAQSSENTKNTPEDAYGDYSNQGVTTTSTNGVAILTVKKPGKYIVPYKGELTRHIHYRYWTENGMASSLYTIDI